MRFLVLFALVLPAAQPPARPWPKEVPFPAGAAHYETTAWTQSIVVRDNRDAIDYIARTTQELKWQYSGGLAELWGWTSDKYKTLPAPPQTWIGNIQVKNSFGRFQPNRGLLRSYAVGSRFDDVLSVKGTVFEHRMREKTAKGWTAKILYQDKTAFPKGYTGLKQTCSSCHDESGSGEYGVGLVPGGDTVFSDPLDWNLLR